MDKTKIEEEISVLKTIFEMHTSLRMIKDEKEFMEHIDAVLDRVSELEEMLNNLND